ncbi:hypothetical protein [Fontibacillus sp. BL9]|uniref:hypothetical protein n=1 Tax=Fontibacillus sp. BL9 TaxID=3389971 RepID=UPI0039782657
MKKEAEANQNKNINPEAIKEQMLAYLQEKYGDEFAPLTLSPSGLAYSYDTLVAYPKNGNKGDSFEVWGTRMDDGSYNMSDGYFGIYIKPEYESVLSEIVGGIYKDYKLYTEFGEGVLPDRLNKDTKLEEIYREDENFSSETVVFVKQSSVEGKNVEEGLLKIAEQMRGKKMVGFVRLFVVYDDKFESIDPGVSNLTTLRENGYFLDNYKSVRVRYNLGIKLNGQEVESDG